LHELRRILRHTNKVGRAILIAVCGEVRAMKEFERQAGWRDRYGIERLREAFDDVAECQSLIARRRRPEELCLRLIRRVGFDKHLQECLLFNEARSVRF